MTKSPERKARGIRRYHALREANLCTLCKTPLFDDKAVCPPCAEKRKKPKVKAPIRTTCFVGDICVIPLAEVLEVLELTIDYYPDRFEFSGSRGFSADRLDITPFDALKAEGLLKPETFEAKVAAYRKAQKAMNKPKKPRIRRVDNGQSETQERESA
jgi:hypothetical protein